MDRVSAIDCLTVYGINYTNMSFLYYHGNVRKNEGMRGNIETGVLIYGRNRACCLCFLIHLSLPLV